ncbi:MAG: LysR family transcriptional regulator [Mogibacterium sp.]|nr:LysR family transcriptional regulator [Mogibacterium sp.]
MRLSKFALFVEIYKCGSFSKAAEKLSYTQSAISQFVQSLENDLGVTLLHRSKKGFVLTTDGERMLPLFTEIHDAEMRLGDMLVDNPEQLKSTIRIGVFPSISCSILPEAMKSFSQKYPLVEYQVLQGNYNEVEDYIVNGKVDIGFIRYPSVHQLDIISFEPEPLVLIFHKDHPFSGKSIVNLSDLEGEKFILNDDGSLTSFMDHFRKNGTSLSISQIVKGNLSQIGFIKAGLGISMIPQTMVPIIPADVLWRPVDNPPTRTIAIACRDFKRLSKVYQLFHEELLSVSTMEKK